MKLTNYLLNINPFMLGTWLLRYTNDPQLKIGNSYLILDYDNNLKLKTTYNEGIIGKKKSRSGLLENILINDKDIVVTIKYSTCNEYSQSILGIKIPEIKSKNYEYQIERQFTISQNNNNTLLIKDINLNLYYLFDLELCKTKTEISDTKINTIIFSQIISFFLNLFLAYYIHL
jgi:hypothetical protein